MNRSFTLVKVSTASGPKGKSNLGGRFISKTPVAAARKAASRVCRESNIRGVHIKETTQGGAGKVFIYKVSRKVEPREVERDGKIIMYKYKTVAKAM
jgi:hypothetical protein